MIGVRKLDWFVTKSYFLLFCGSFFFCLFLFIMQFLWRYLEDLVGKGLSIEVLGEFFFWASLTLIPQTLPLAILFAALMTFGNLGEKFELTAMKAAGVSLLRITRPLIFLTLFSCGVSFYFQNVTGPYAQVKLWTLLLSMRQTSPELEIPEGSFYDQIPGYNLYIKKKNPANGMLYDVMIYTFADGFANARIIVSDSAKLSVTGDKKYLQLEFYQGEMFENLQSQMNMQLHNVPYRREMFSYKKTLIEFNTDFEKMDEGFMRKQYMSKNMFQLQYSIDSLNLEIDSMGKALYADVSRTLYHPVSISKEDSIKLKKSRLASINIDSLFRVASQGQQERYIANAKSEVLSADWNFRGLMVSDTQRFMRYHQIEWHKKIALSVSCLIFLLIAAPLGSIIRKGGFGTPMVICSVLYVVYLILDTTGQKMGKEGIWEPWMGTWFSSFVLAPVAVFITYKANNDSVVFNPDLYVNLLKRIAGIRDKRHIFKKEVIIEDPDYPALDDMLPRLAQFSEEYLVGHRLMRLPNYFTLWINRGHDEEMIVIRDFMEEIVEQLNNSKDPVVLDKLNSYPIVSANAHRCPFNRGWLNILIGVLVPVGLFFYFRIWRYRIRLYKDLKQTIATSRELMPYIHQAAYPGPAEENLPAAENTTKEWKK